MKKLASIVSASILLCGCDNIAQDKNETAVSHTTVNHTENIELEIRNYIENMLKDYDLKDSEGIRHTITYFDDIESILNKKDRLNEREKYYLKEILKSKSIIKNYVYSNSDSRIKSDFEALNKEYISNVLLPFHSIYNNYLLIIKDNREANEFFDKTMTMMNDVFILELYFIDDELLRKMDKEYLINKNPADLITKYLETSEQYAESKNEFEIVMFSGIKKLVLEWNLNSGDNYSKISDLFTEMNRCFPDKYVDIRENLE